MLTISEHIQNAVCKGHSAWFHRDEIQQLFTDYLNQFKPKPLMPEISNTHPIEMTIKLHSYQQAFSISDVLEELKSAELKHSWRNTNLIKQALILTEECGEVAQAVLNHDEKGATLELVRKELIQTAAMCLRMLKNLPAGVDILEEKHLGAKL